MGSIMIYPVLRNLQIFPYCQFGFRKFHSTMEPHLIFGEKYDFGLFLLIWKKLMILHLERWNFIEI